MYNRIFNTSLHTFNHESFQNWRKELDSIPVEIQIAEKKVADSSQALGKLQTELDEFIQKREISSLCDKINTLKLQINVLTYPEKSETLKNNLKLCENELSANQKSVMDVERSLEPLRASVKWLQNGIEIQEAVVKKNQVQEQIGLHAEEMKLISKQLIAINKKLKDAKNQYKSKQSYLIKLRLQKTLNYKIDDNYYSLPTNPPNYDSRFDTRAEKTTKNLAKVNDNLIKNNISQLESESETLSSNIRIFEKEEKKLLSRKNVQKDADLKLLREFNLLNNKITHFKDKGYYFQGELPEWKIILDKKIKEKKPFEIKKEKLDIRVKQNKQEIFNLRDSISQLRFEYEKNTKNLKNQHDLSEKENLSKLNYELDQALKTYSEYETNKEEQLKKILEQSQQNTKDTEELDYLFSRQALLNSYDFLKKLRDNPEILLAELVTAIEDSVNAFEKNNPINQPLRTRILLTDIKNTDNRSSYYHLCGFLWNALNQLEEEDQELHAVFKQILKLHPVDRNEAITEYLNSAKHHSTHNREELQRIQNEHERTEYKKAFQDFNEMLQLVPNESKQVKILYLKSQSLVNAIDYERIIADKKSATAFDFKYHTTLLNKAIELFKKPESSKLQQEFHHLASFNKQGNPSYKKQIAGAALMFLGSIVTVACSIAKYVTLDFINPATTTGVASGISLFGTGLSLFTSGREKEPAKQIKDFEKAAKASPSATTIPAFSRG